LDDDGLLVNGLGPVKSAAESPQQVPERVALQRLLLVWEVALGDSAGGPALKPGHVLVA
jgi:hypothetical protein